MRARGSRSRRQSMTTALVATGVVMLTACTGAGSAVVTVTVNSVVATVTDRPGPSIATRYAAPSDPAPPLAQTRPTSTSALEPSSTRSSSTTTGAGGDGAGGVPAGGTEPDGFKIVRLEPGQRPPQFIIFSFDGTGWHEKWQYWFSIMQKVPLHFTGFLSGTYMLSKQTRMIYHGPGHDVGESAISWYQPSDIPIEISDLNRSLSLGNEVGSHFNGHFCDPGDPPGGQVWDTSDWNSELDQFFALVRNVDTDNDITAKLDVTATQIHGERTPCLQGRKDDLYPALESHGMTYDSSIVRTGLSWPVKSVDGRIWEMGMSEFPTHGSGHPQITMDYNYYYQQESDAVLGGTAPPESRSAADSAQVLATYQDMLHAAMTDGVDEPLIIGNHFNDWNNRAYSDAVANFALAVCGQPGISCVPFRDLVDWMNAQSPAVIAALQNHRSNLGGCPYLAWPRCDGLIHY